MNIHILIVILIGVYTQTLDYLGMRPALKREQERNREKIYKSFFILKKAKLLFIVLNIKNHFI